MPVWRCAWPEIGSRRGKSNTPTTSPKSVAKGALMSPLGIMIEGQEGLTWDRFFRVAVVVEDLGFESLFRSDHLTALDGDSKRNSLALWPSLGVLAARTHRLRFGPLVCAVTFHHPALLAKNAAAVDQLSGGRFELGLGAGWYGGEHRRFGVP